MSSFFGILIFLFIIFLFGILLVWAADFFKVQGNPLVEQIDAVLPQTQCGQCGYPGCRQYAEAVAKGEAEINLCPGGGQEAVKALAELLGVEEIPLNAENAQERAEDVVAFIDESKCIGCGKCIPDCPVNAILGTAKHMHTIISNECTGCTKCVDACPQDCITMIKRKPKVIEWTMAVPERIPLLKKGKGD